MLFFRNVYHRILSQASYNAFLIITFYFLIMDSDIYDIYDILFRRTKLLHFSQICKWRVVRSG